MKRLTLALTLALATVIGGCDQLPTDPPSTVQQLRASDRDQLFTSRTIGLYNLRRVLSKELPPDQRLESLRVLEQTDLPETETCPALASALNDPNPQVRQAVEAYRMKRGYPEGAEVASTEPPHEPIREPVYQPPPREPVREPVYEPPAKPKPEPPLVVHPIPAAPAPGVLAETVRKWAAAVAKSADEDEQAKYRQEVETITGKRWDEGLLDQLNTSTFTARGSAIEVLTAKLPPATLLRLLDAMEAHNDTIRSLKDFGRRFNYVPHSRYELLASVGLVQVSDDKRTGAAKLAAKWSSESLYHFSVRDFHLLSRLYTDPLRDLKIPRQQLVAEIAKSVAGRKNVKDHVAAAKSTFRRGRLVDFEVQSSSLNLVDLWNIHLLDEMLRLPRIREAFKVTAMQDRADTTTQFGGLIFYDQGKADPMLYPAGKKGDDEAYVPSQRMLTDSCDSLCYFVCHFNKVKDDPSMVGPGKAEMDFVRERCLYGLLLTTAANNKLNAAYFTPDGLVIDLGDYPLP